MFIQKVAMLRDVYEEANVMIFRLFGSFVVNIILFAGFLFFTLPAYAFDEYIDSPELPEKAVTKFVTPLLEAINSGDPNLIEAFIKDHYSTGFLQEDSLENHIDVLLDVSRTHGEVSYYVSRDFSDIKLLEQEIFVALRAESGFWLAAEMAVDERDPSKIDSLFIGLANPPTINISSDSDPQSTDPQSIEQALTALKTYLETMEKNDLFAGSVLVAKNDKVLYRSAFGLAHRGALEPNTVQTKYAIGAINGMFTSIAVMQLIEAGKIAMNDKLSKYVDETWLSKEVTEKIQIRHLLSNTSGLGYLPLKFDDENEQDYTELEDFRPFFKGVNLESSPGTLFDNGGAGIFLLGVVLELVTGENYFKYIENTIYKKAGMNNSSLLGAGESVKNLANNYIVSEDDDIPWYPQTLSFSQSPNSADKGFATVDDLHRFALALTSNEFLNKATTESMFSPQISGYAGSYGYGVYITETSEDKIVGYFGGFLGGMTSNLDIYLQKGYITIVLSNHNHNMDPNVGTRAVKNKIRELLAMVDDASVDAE